MSGENTNSGRSPRLVKLRLWALVISILSGRLLLPLAFALLLSTVLTPILFISPDHLERSGAGSFRSSPLQRLALVVLQSAGVIAANPNFGKVVMDPYGGGSYIDELEWFPMESPIANCAHDRLVGALVAIESYARPEWWRRIEISVAHLVHDLTGYFPDWTYGIGQIRLKTARGAMRAAVDRITTVFGAEAGGLPSDEVLFDLLKNDCDNTRIAQLVLAEKNPESAIEAAEVYHGGKSNLVVPGIVTHTNLVLELIEMVMPDTGGGDLGVFRVRWAPESGKTKWSTQVLEFPDEMVVDGKWPVVCLDNWSKSDEAQLMLPKLDQEGSQRENLDFIENSLAEIPMSNIKQSHFEMTLVYPHFSVDTMMEVMGYRLELLDKLESLGIGAPGLWRRISTKERQQDDTCRTMMTISPKPTALYNDVDKGLKNLK